MSFFLYLERRSEPDVNRPLAMRKNRRAVRITEKPCSSHYRRPGQVKQRSHVSIFVQETRIRSSTRVTFFPEGSVRRMRNRWIVTVPCPLLEGVDYFGYDGCRLSSGRKLSHFRRGSGPSVPTGERLRSELRWVVGQSRGGGEGRKKDPGEKRSERKDVNGFQGVSNGKSAGVAFA